MLAAFSGKWVNSGLKTFLNRNTIYSIRSWERIRERRFRYGGYTATTAAFLFTNTIEPGLPMERYLGGVFVFAAIWSVFETLGVAIFASSTNATRGIDAGMARSGPSY